VRTFAGLATTPTDAGKPTLFGFAPGCRFDAPVDVTEASSKKDAIRIFAFFQPANATFTAGDRSRNHILIARSIESVPDNGADPILEFQFRRLPLV